MNGSKPSVRALFLGRAREIVSDGSGEWWDKPWVSGFFKAPQKEACWLAYGGLRGDEQADRVNHGGVEKAVCVYPEEHYPGWRATLQLPELPWGAFGENLTTSGLLEAEVCIGDRYTLGEAVVEVSQPRQPCWKLARRWRVKDLAAQVERTGYTGFYFRVRQHGMVREGDTLRLQARPCPEWTIQKCNEVMHHQKHDLAAARALAAVALLSASWKDSLWARSAGEGKRDSSAARVGLEGS